MDRLKAVVDFSPYPEGEVTPIAQNIHDRMTETAAIFPEPPVSMAALQLLVDDYRDKLVAKSSRATSDFVAFDLSREKLEAALGSLGHYVNSIAKGDPAIVAASGFPSYSTRRPPNFGPPDAPANLRLEHGKVSGSICARYRPGRRRSMNEVQTCLGDAREEANWTKAGYFNGSKADLTGLTPGVFICIRVRTVGLRGVMGAWSDLARIMVL